MPEPRRTPFPAAAVSWMFGDVPRRVLDLASGRGALAQTLAGGGHQVFTVDRSSESTARLAYQLPTGLHVVAQAEALPYTDQQFDVVSAADALHRFAPGLVDAEIARVLRPGGSLVAVYTTRDDTVPWVRKLAAIVQAVDPDAMQGDYGQDSVAALDDSPYFTGLERRDFRNWVPIDRPGLVEMVARRPATGQLDEADRTRVLGEVGDLYDSYARTPDPLLLPFQTSCWRATVDQRQLAINSADATDDGLEIPLGF